MPETAVHEHRQPRFSEHEIGFAECPALSAPAGDAVKSQQPQQPHQRQFRLAVPAPANARHHFAALGLGENVGHRRVAMISLSQSAGFGDKVPEGISPEVLQLRQRLAHQAGGRRRRG